MNIDLKSDYHLHTLYSDGISTAEEMILGALGKNFRKIAFTDHMPLPFSDKCAIKIENLNLYRAEIAEFKKKYAGKIEILLGLEVDYLPDYLDWIQKIVKKKWDFLLASVHFFTRQKQKKNFAVDMNERQFQEALAEGFSGSIKALCEDYYITLQKAASTGWFDAVGHFDLVKKFNKKQNPFFSEQESWYKKLVLDTLNVVSKNNLKIEINMSGLDKPVSEQYPSLWIVRKCKKKGIPLIMGSDAHKAEDIGKNFESFLRL